MSAAADLDPFDAEIERWSNEYIAHRRSGVPAQQAHSLANREAELGAEDQPNLYALRADTQSPATPVAVGMLGEEPDAFVDVDEVLQEEDRKVVPRLPHVRDESITAQQYADAAWQWLERRRLAREQEAAGQLVKIGEHYLGFLEIEALEGLKAFWAEHNRAPTILELAKKIGVTGMTDDSMRVHVSARVANLREKGLVDGKQGSPKPVDLSKPREPSAIVDVRDPSVEVTRTLATDRTRGIKVVMADINLGSPMRRPVIQELEWAPKNHKPKKEDIMTTQKEQLLAELAKKGNQTAKELADKVGIADTWTSTVLRGLLNEKKVDRVEPKPYRWSIGTGKMVVEDAPAAPKAGTKRDESRPLAADVVAALTKARKALTLDQIAEAVGGDRGSVSSALRGLLTREKVVRTGGHKDALWSMPGVAAVERAVSGKTRAPAPAVESKSVQKRKAVQRDKPAPASDDPMAALAAMMMQKMEQERAALDAKMAALQVLIGTK